MTKDLIIVQRNVVVQEVVDVIQYWQGMGKPVVIDLDDAYHILPWSNPAHRFWIENPEQRQPDPLAMLERGLSISDGLLAPNRLLLQDWSHCCKGYYVQNYARKEWWSELPSREEMKKKLGLEGRTVIGWGGSVSHYDSWWGSGLREATRAITLRHPEVVWVICGNDPRVAEQLPVPLDNKRLQPGVPPDQWPHIVKSFDIGVAPLFGDYDQRRSWIKGLEYMLAGVPWVASKGEPYRDMEQFGLRVRPIAQEWEGAIRFILEKLPDLQREAEALIPLAQQWFAVNQMETYARVYEHIRHDFSDSRGRLPGLFFVNPTQPSRAAGG